MWQEFYDNYLNYSLIDSDDFVFSALNIIIFVALYFIGRVVTTIINRSLDSLNLKNKSLKIEGRRFAVSKLVNQIINVSLFVLCIVSLKINNMGVDLSVILNYEFFRLREGGFHIKIYHLFVIVLTIVTSRLALSILRYYIHKATAKRKNIDEGDVYVYVQLAKYLVYTIAILVVLRSFGAYALIWDIVIVAGVGFALGAQFVIRDYISGFLLLFEGSIKVGDVIEIDNIPAGEPRIATIEKINLRSSKVRTTNGKVLIIPNSNLTHENVISWTLGDQVTRFKIEVSVAYGSDTEKVSEILIRCAKDHPRVSSLKDVKARLKNFGDNGLEMQLLFWANKNFEIEQYKSDIRFAIDKEFRKEGITIPFPQRDVHSS